MKLLPLVVYLGILWFAISIIGPGSDARAETGKAAGTHESGERGVDVKAVFQRRQDRVRSFRFRWKETVRSFKSPFAEKFSKDIAAAKTREQKAFAQSRKSRHPVKTTEYEQRVTLIFDGKRVRYEQEGNRPPSSDPDSDPAPFQHMAVFDGVSSTLYFPAGNPRQEEGLAGIYADDQTGGFEYLGARPIILNYRGADWIRSRQTAGLIDTSEVRSGLIGEQKCVVIGASDSASGFPHAMSLWIDPSRDNIVMREVKHTNGQLSSQTDISYKKNDEYGWVPISWKRHEYWSDKTPENDVDAEVLEYELNPVLPDETFVLEMAPGTRVREVAKNQVYLVDDSGALQPTAPATQPNPEDSRFRFWLILVNSCLILTFLGFFLRRYSRRKRSET